MTTTTAQGPFELSPPAAPAPPAAPTAAPPTAAPPATGEQAAPHRSSVRAFVVVGAVLSAILVGALVWWLTTRGKESTDDAQIQADVVQLAPRVGGAVSKVMVQENQHVKAGEAVLQLDQADYAVKVRQADSDVKSAQAALVRSRPQASFDTRELVRSKELRAGQAISNEALERAEMTAGTGRASVMQAEATLSAAQAAADSARLQLSYTTVVAPADGWVSTIQAHPGQLLAADQSFAEFVPDHAYVVANFKETQIGDIHPGQRAKITLDTYGHRDFEGRVESLSAGTGAEFSLLPPNNATGNFVKVVQRVPVRVELLAPPSDLPLRAGLSADVTVYLK